MSDRQKRLQEVYEHLRRWFGIHTQADFANSMKYSRNAISLALNGNEKYLTDKLFESVCKAYPDTFNLDYLLTGNGELITKKEPETAPIDKQQDALTYAAIQVGKMMADLSKRPRVSEKVRRTGSTTRAHDRNTHRPHCPARQAHRHPRPSRPPHPRP